MTQFYEVNILDVIKLKRDLTRVIIFKRFFFQVFDIFLYKCMHVRACVCPDTTLTCALKHKNWPQRAFWWNLWTAAWTKKYTYFKLFKVLQPLHELNCKHQCHYEWCCACHGSTARYKSWWQTLHEEGCQGRVYYINVRAICSELEQTKTKLQKLETYLISCPAMLLSNIWYLQSPHLQLWITIWKPPQNLLHRNNAVCRKAFCAV